MKTMFTDVSGINSNDEESGDDSDSSGSGSRIRSNDEESDENSDSSSDSRSNDEESDEDSDSSGSGSGNRSRSNDEESDEANNTGNSSDSNDEETDQSNTDFSSNEKESDDGGEEEVEGGQGQGEYNDEDKEGRIPVLDKKRKKRGPKVLESLFDDVLLEIQSKLSKHSSKIIKMKYNNKKFPDFSFTKGLLGVIVEEIKSEGRSSGKKILKEKDEIISVNGHNLHLPFEKASTVLNSEVKSSFNVRIKIVRSLSPEELLASPSPIKKPNIKTSSSLPATTNSSESKHKVDKIQKRIAEKIVEKMIQSHPQRSNYKHFDFFWIGPEQKILEAQTIDRIQSFLTKTEIGEYLQDLQAKNHLKYISERVLRNVKSKDSDVRFNRLIKRIEEEKDTFFFLVIDEAHFAATKNNNIHNFLQKTENCLNKVVLKVTATGYSLVTKNSRIPAGNMHDIWKYLKKETDTKYYGIEQFVSESEKPQLFQCYRCKNYHNHTDPVKLKPGTIGGDENFESMLHENSELRKLVEKETKDSTNIDADVRLYAILIHYFSALLWLYGFSHTLTSELGKIIQDTKANKTIQMLKGVEQYMIAVRFPAIKDGQFFKKYVRKLRNILGRKKSFSVSLDINDKSENLCEDHFLPKLQNMRGDPNFRPRLYADLNGLGIILINVDKGKMGITYPASSRYFDLRCRYTTLSSVTRAACEQDIGRACRYKSENVKLPTILVSESLRRQMLGANEGIFKLPPDNTYSMTHNVYTPPKPEDEFNLEPYKMWSAGENHRDYNNERQDETIHLLMGRPQIGKTGIFLWIGFYLWKAIGSPAHTKSDIKTSRIRFEVKLTRVRKYKRERKTGEANLGKYPDYSLVQKQSLSSPLPSPRYGDFNNRSHREHYLDGKCYPTEDVLTDRNSLLKRTKKKESFERRNETASQINDIQTESPQITVIEETVSDNFRSKAIPPDERSSEFKKFYNTYEIPEVGILHLHKKKMPNKWYISSAGGKPTLNPDFINYPPVIIPSRGRSGTALLDLTDAMRNENFIEIVVIIKEEAEEYLQTLCNQRDIDVLVLKECQPDEKETAGRSRFFSKKLAESITEGTGIKFFFLQDDNVCSWKGITLRNDPNPMFETTMHPHRSQNEDISLYCVLNHFSLNKLNEKMSKFSIIGFSSEDKFGNDHLVNAYSRKHVFGAVILNLGKLTDIDYKKQLWCMEDIFFNDDTNHGDGVIVKCQRFQIRKMRLDHGGVVPEDMPDSVREMMKDNLYWSQAGVRHEAQSIRGVASRGASRNIGDKRSSKKTPQHSSLFVENIRKAKQKYGCTETFLKKVKKHLNNVLYEGDGSVDDVQLALKVQKIFVHEKFRRIDTKTKTKLIFEHKIFDDTTGGSGMSAQNDNQSSSQPVSRSGKEGPHHHSKNRTRPVSSVRQTPSEDESFHNDDRPTRPNKPRNRSPSPSTSRSEENSEEASETDEEEPRRSDHKKSGRVS